MSELLTHFYDNADLFAWDREPVSAIMTMLAVINDTSIANNAAQMYLTLIKICICACLRES